jgi:ubiquitin carboxyl-terminal hydrolase 8
MGIKNPNVLCFANSSLQAMFATPGFAQEIWTASWKDVYKVPMKPDERIENPQLLTKFLEQVFKFLNQGSFKALEAKTIMVSSPRPKP